MALNLTEMERKNLQKKIFIFENIGIYCVLLIIVSTISNSVLIFILVKNRKKLLHHLNILILVLAILSLIGTLLELPLVIDTAFKGE